MTNKNPCSTYTMLDADSNEIKVDAETLVRRAIEEGWTIDREIAAAIKELTGIKD